MTQPILEFKGDDRYLSNFYITSFVWDGILWPHAEAAYQSAKTLDRNTRILFSQMNNPVVSKRQGKIVKLRSDWEKVKFDIMLDIVREKFKQNLDIKVKLISTGNAHLEEDNNHGDRIWGVCSPGSSNGLNYLGKVLMQVRNEFTTI